MRDIIKYKLDKNMALFLSGDVKREYSKSTVTAQPCQGGAKFPPFQPRERNAANPNEAPKNALTEQEAAEFKKVILAQFEEFQQTPPFTIQRLCELCLRPTDHYKHLGKYLRAVERTLLVTSTWDAFPVSPDKITSKPSVSTVHISINALSAPTTPIFSPIPFLHEDARRSSSRSPPPSPLVLPAIQSGGTATTMPHVGAEGAAPQALGLVDELDDPTLSSTTDVPSKPIFGSLEERFTKAETNAEGSAAGPEEKKQKIEG
ncbi:PPP4R2-domain-containing protein [Fomitopsis serialis]|uniref:PPP4R2-domain-containing protein n=1 Tax=Fomitopsis serialis TaxID=139415 RepID=UPI0020085C85|nr:PPP4R2-domain-containing protein [Neoantrodia serialis]KAH9926173.1 PPP4R2-domain-containing protein [Neoantrodia serialis]